MGEDGKQALPAPEEKLALPAPEEKLAVSAPDEKLAITNGPESEKPDLPFSDAKPTSAENRNEPPAVE
jgi:hypothetical protein